MKLVTYAGLGGLRVASVVDGGYVDLNHADPSLPTSLSALLAASSGLARARAAEQKAAPLPTLPGDLMPPIPEPFKVICVGLNYADHARETGKQPPSEPVIFCKFPTALLPHGRDIVLPRVSTQVDYEAELVVVIGKGGRNISPADAWQHVGGYCCGNDVSARDWQLHKPGGQWLLGKSFDTFAPLGPHMVTADEVPDPGQLKIGLRLNGQTMQSSNTNQLIFPINELIAYVSQVCSLAPGDLIYTGTPAGVGVARTPPVFLKPGDVVEVEIERVGILRNSVVGDR